MLGALCIFCIYAGEAHVERFMNAVISGDTQQATRFAPESELHVSGFLRFGAEGSTAGQELSNRDAECRPKRQRSVVVLELSDIPLFPSRRTVNSPES